MEIPDLSTVNIAPVEPPAAMLIQGDSSPRELPSWLTWWSTEQAVVGDEDEDVSQPEWESAPVLDQAGSILIETPAPPLIVEITTGNGDPDDWPESLGLITAYPSEIGGIEQIPPEGSLSMKAVEGGFLLEPPADGLESRVFINARWNSGPKGDGPLWYRVWYFRTK